MADIRSRALDKARANFYFCADPDSASGRAEIEQAWRVLIYVSRKTISEIRRTKFKTEANGE